MDRPGANDRPIWEPSRERAEASNMARFLRFVRERTGNPDLVRYAPLWEFSVREPQRFWPFVWEFCGIRASGDLEPTMENPGAMPGARFFPNARLNFAENLLRYRDGHPALVFRNEWGHARELSYAELASQVGRLAQALRTLGVRPGDRVAGLMPNMPETIIAMLAASALGATWSSTSPDFGVAGIVDRFGQIAPKVLFTVDAYPYGGKSHGVLDKVRGVLAEIPGIEHTIVLDYSGRASSLDGLRGAVDWNALLDGHGDTLDCTLMPFNHPQYIMYSSGTTGVPKCIVHGAGGTLLQHLKELVLHTDLKREDRIFYFTTCGWMMWNWLVSSLAVGATLVLYDGSPFHPDGHVLWDLADEVGISVFGTSARWIAACDKAGIKPRRTHKLAALRSILSTGSPLAPESFDYVYRDVKERVMLASISGGTDIVSCFALGNPLLPVYRGELQCRGLGMQVDAFDDDGQSVRGQPGELVCLAPFPSMPVAFWNDPDGRKYHAAYFERFPGVWAHGDFVEITAHGGLVIHGRSDATLNPGGVRIGTSEIYRQVEQVPEVLESVAIGQRWHGDERVVLFVRLREGIVLDEALRARIREVIRANATPRHVPARIEQVTDIPRTRSGKVTEVAVRDTIHGRAAKNTEALANPQSLAEFAALRPSLETH